VFRPSSYQEHYHIVEPGTSDKAAFDPDAYHKAMRDGRSEGMMHYLAAFLGGGVIGMFLGYAFAPGPRFLIAIGCGLAFGVGLYRLRLAKLRRSNASAVKLQAQLHDLEVTAKRLEIEEAKAAGAFAKWEKS
jgi:hypothetical protein